jgi:hypothetical protein
MELTHNYMTQYLVVPLFVSISSFAFIIAQLHLYSLQLNKHLLLPVFNNTYGYLRIQVFSKIKFLTS